ncbi:MAG: hypothetical protein IJE29_06145 [Firmicutes bacterium]|nr:hypothetical protein [Bacillota bacterium]MBQ3199434.1 hypothetical protein [Bacillota bacterium]
MVLCRNDIAYRCENENLIEGYRPENIQTCSYDLRMGEQYYFYRKKDGDTVHISTLGKGDILKIPPNSICYVMTEEIVNMPLDLTASISLSFGLIKSGVMLAAQPPYDPGYRGKTVALLHNLSNQPVKIERGEHILNIVFTELSKPLESEQLYTGKYQGLNNLGDYCKEVKVGAVFELKQELEKRKERFNSFLPNVLTFITVVIAVLTVLFALLIGMPSIGGLFDDMEKESSSPEFFVDTQKDILTICIDGQYYELNLNEQVSQPDENSEK